MKLHNTLGRRTEEFRPIKPGKVKLYTCGPTVYDYAHIGNLRSFVFDDTLRRVLMANKYDVKHVMNITDVGHLSSDTDAGEDKLEKGASREHKSVWEVADFYIKAFEADIEKLNILPPNAYHGPHGVYARATDFIPQQLAIIKILLDKEFAYVTGQAIYFDVTKLADYGKLARLRLADQETGARQDVVVDKQKHNPHDFALWFFKVGRFVDHSMAWASSWGEGFPGWHLECSAIIHETLGEPLDIHTGGVDHIGTHHTNEIAQTEAAFDTPLANYWLHNEYLLADGKKMSKSLGNFYRLKDVQDRQIKPLALRYLFLQSHYRSQSNFTWQALAAAQSRLTTLQAFADLRFQPDKNVKPRAKGSFERYQAAILNILNEDLATPKALANLDKLVDESMAAVGIHPVDIDDFQIFINFLDEVFGLDLLSSKDIDDRQKKLIAERQDYRQAQNWAEADRIRQELLQSGITLYDSQNSTFWSRAS
jgi:cysteinyl-tRNA synthetase